VWRAASETSAGANPVAVWRTDDDAETIGDRLTADVVAPLGPPIVAGSCTAV